MSAFSSLARRTLLTAAGWAVGGWVLGGAFADLFERGVGLRTPAFASDPGWIPYAAAAGALFALAAGALRASGSLLSVSRRAMGVVGALATGLVLIVVDWRVSGEALAVVADAPNLTWTALALGAVLGWGTLAVGGARE